MDWFSSSLKRFFALGLMLLAFVSLGFARTRKSGKISHVKAQTRTAHSRHDSAPAKSKKSARPHTSASRTHTKYKRIAAARRTRSSRSHGQQAIDSARVLQIQQALIRARYMNSDPSGVWDDQTRAAMVRFQTDNGWQSKVVPDSRALIKLGLGPNYDNVLNPESSWIQTAPAPPVSNAAAQLEPGGAVPNRGAIANQR